MDWRPERLWGRWRRELFAETSARLASRTRSADRAALLRTMAWLGGGRLATMGHDLSWLDDSTAARFGLAFTQEYLRWLGPTACDPDALLPTGVDAAAVLDEREARPTLSAPPDGILGKYAEDYAGYRIPTQKAALRALATMPPGATLMVTMPTGSGKSLLFQVGSQYWNDVDGPSGVIVVVPTVSLARDHQRTLFERQVSAEAVVGGVDPKRAYERFAAGDLRVLVVNPETLFRSGRELVHQLAAGRLRARLSALFIDEAHIVESWGRWFRPDFQQLEGLVRDIRVTSPELRVVLLSATLTDAARAHLSSRYGHDSELLTVEAGVPRYELDLITKQYPSEGQRSRAFHLAVDLLPRPAIVYVTQPSVAERLADELADRGYRRPHTYTGDTGNKARDLIGAAWAKGSVDLVVATAAFGLGIDKADVRTVIHARAPADAARLYQEVGRAGRDGRRATGLCLWTDADLAGAEGQARRDWLGRPKSLERWQALVRGAAYRGGGVPTELQGDGTRRMVVDVSDAPPRLIDERGKTHRTWNRSLLNLLQRSRQIAVVDAAEAEKWVVVVQDDRLLVDDEMAAAINDMGVVRDREQAEAVHDRRALRSALLQAHEECLLVALFRLIDAAAPGQLFGCGRCVACRAKRLSPPAPEAVPFGGLQAVWPAPIVPGGAPIGLSVFAVEGDLRNDLDRLAQHAVRRGFAQFVVADDDALRWSAALAKQPGPGLVVTVPELQRGYGLMQCGTLVVVHDGDSYATWQRVEEKLRTPVRIGVVVVDGSSEHHELLRMAQSTPRLEAM